jgi:transposase
MNTNNCIGLLISINPLFVPLVNLSWSEILFVMRPFQNKRDLLFTMIVINTSQIYPKESVDKSIIFEFYHNCALGFCKSDQIPQKTVQIWFRIRLPPHHECTILLMAWWGERRVILELIFGESGQICQIIKRSCEKFQR